MDCQTNCKKSWKDIAWAAGVIMLGVLFSELVIVPAVKQTGVLEAHYTINVDCPCKAANPEPETGPDSEAKPDDLGDDSYATGTPDPIPSGPASQGLILPAGRTER